MKLAEWIVSEGISLGELARRTGAANARTVQRHVKGFRKPDVRMVDAYSRVTGGKVTAADFLSAVAE